MINRENWLEAKDYLRYLTKVRQQSEKTVSKRRGQLRHILEWAGEKSFSKARTIDPTFPAYLLTARNDGKEALLSAESLKSACETARRFFDWLKMVKPRKYGSLTNSWIDTLRPSRSRGMQSVVHEHQFYSYSDMLKIAALDVDTLRKKRDRAAMCFLLRFGNEGRCIHQHAGRLRGCEKPQGVPNSSPGCKDQKRQGGDHIHAASSRADEGGRRVGPERSGKCAGRICLVRSLEPQGRQFL